MSNNQLESDPFFTFPESQDFHDALHRIGKSIHKTPVVTSIQADERSGRNLFFKLENFQKTGSFKCRGALNAILKMLQTKPDLCGVVTHSSGNHGQGTAWACQHLGVPSYIVVAARSPQAKKDAILGYGGNLVECGHGDTDRSDTCEKLRVEKGLAYIPSCTHRDVIAGQGTVALEFLSQVPDLDAIICSVGSGGLAAGVAAAAKSIKPDIKVFLACPTGKLMEECLRSGKRPWADTTRYMDTLADGIRRRSTVKLVTPALIRLVEKDVFEMTDEEMIEGMKFSFERMKIVIEMSAGAAVAAAFSDKFKSLDSGMRNVGVILCGGNLDIDNLPW